MKEKIKQKGFIQIPLLIAIITVVAGGVGATIVLYRQGKLAPFASNIAQVFQKRENVTVPAEQGTKLEELQMKEPLTPKEEIIQPESSQVEELNDKKQKQKQEEPQLQPKDTIYVMPPASSLPQIEIEERYQDPKEKLIKELEIYISSEEQKKEQTAIRLLAEGQFGEYSGWVATSYLPPSTVEEIIKKEAYLVGKEGYLGKITKNRFDSESIFYKLGKYGNLIFGNGIWPTLSSNNPFSVVGEKPKIYLSDGTFFACLSINLVSVDCNNRILNPKRLILYMYDNYSIDKKYLDYIYE